MLASSEYAEVERIRLLKYRYIRALDTHDVEIMRSVFIENARVWFSSGALSMDGREAIVSMFKGVFSSILASSHIVTHPEIELTSPNTATGIWRMEDTVYFDDPDPSIGKLMGIRKGDELRGAGYYYDEYVKIDKDWKFKSTGYVRIYECSRSVGSTETVLTIDPKLGLKS